MPESGQYVRIRGKVTGPFDIAGLQKLVRRGALSRIHEVSADRVNWAPAGEFEELFPAATSPVAVHSEPISDFEQPSPVTPSAGASTRESYFYVQNGVTVGPVPLNVLLLLAQNGTLGPSDLCWPDGAQLASAAGQLPILAPIFSGQGSALPGRRAPRQVIGASADAASAAISASAIWSRTIGVVVASSLLLVLNLPIGMDRDRTIWWWDAMSQSGSGTAMVILFFVLFSALLVGPIALLTTGLLRAWFFVAIALFSLTLFLTTGLNVPSSGSYFFGLLVPYLAAALIGVSGFRTGLPDVRVGAILQGVLGGALIFSLIILGVLALATNSPESPRDFSAEHLPGWAIAVLSMGIIGGLAGLAAGTLGLLGLRQKLSTGVNAATTACCSISILLPFLAVVIGAAQSVEVLPDQRQPAFFLIIRICAGFAAYLALMATGMGELFTSYATAK